MYIWECFKYFNAKNFIPVGAAAWGLFWFGLFFEENVHFDKQGC